MDRSPGFGFTKCYLSPYSDSLSLRLRGLYHLTLQHLVTRQLIIQKARHQAFQWPRKTLGKGIGSNQKAKALLFRIYYAFSIHLSYLTWHSPLTACKYTVSGTISLCFRSTFHLSLTVLVHYRSKGIFSLRRWSSQIQTGFHVSRPT